MKLTDFITPQELADELVKIRWGKRSHSVYGPRPLDATNPKTDMDKFALAMMPFSHEFNNGLDMFAAVMVTIQAMQDVLNRQPNRKKERR